MKPHATVSLLLFTALLCLSSPTLGQRQEEWTWKDKSGNVRSRADLDRIIGQHKIWFGSERNSRGLEGWWESDLKGADLSRVDLSYCMLELADLKGTNLSGANLSPVVLKSATLEDADLTDANLRGAILADTFLGNANLKGVVFEPRDLIRPDYIASARNMELMTYRDNPGPLNQLRKQFQDAGYREQERQITYLLNREEARRDVFVERWFKRIAFELTCQYGLTPGRPLLIGFGLWFFFSGVYVVFMHWPGSSGIYLVGNRMWRGKSNSQGIQIRPRAIRATNWWKLPFLWLRLEWRVVRAAMFFSLMSAFNIGFRDINFGRWLRMLTRREYDLKAVGWARTLSGFQSLLSVYLIALWVLTYFGRPFG